MMFPKQSIVLQTIFIGKCVFYSPQVLYSDQDGVFNERSMVCRSDGSNRSITETWAKKDRTRGMKYRYFIQRMIQRVGLRP